MRRYGRRPVEHLHSLGILGPTLVAVHGIHLSDREIDILAESGTGVVHCPESNMKLASGAAGVKNLIARGVTVGLGTDGPASNNNLDMFEEMRSAALMSKLIERDPESLGAATVLRMATTHGARLLGMDSEIGSLKPGKLADVVVIDMNRPHLTPVYDPVSHLVYAARGSEVRDVIVNGRLVVQNGLLTTIDEEDLKRRASACAADMAKSLGIKTFFGV
jgi:5-methylthioadenosine/S-adenosylhomocysteine deaminase